MPSDADRLAEQAKYERAYSLTNYGMGKARQIETVEFTSHWAPGSLLDVGCGRGEYIAKMRENGFEAEGVDRVATLCGDLVTQAWAHDLPFEDGSFDYVTSWDVLEHLLPDDDDQLLHEMWRVCRTAIAVSANNMPKTKESEPGRRDVLHINRRPYAEWAAVIGGLFGDENVTFYPGAVSPAWVAVR